MSNPTFKPSEGKREEFRKYLEKNGVMDGLTKVLVNLYEEPEKPEDALEYIRDRLAMQAGIETYAQMKAKQEELQNKIDTLMQQLEESQAAIAAAAAAQSAEDALPLGEEGGDLPPENIDAPPVEDIRVDE